MLVYLEFARKLPHTGGELIYVSCDDLIMPTILTRE